MPRRFTFADASWFRVPLKVLILTVTVFGLLSLWPALSDSAATDHRRAIFGLLVVVMFMAVGTTFAVAISDSYVEVGGSTVHIRFEAFFSTSFPRADVAAIRYVDPRPRWRYRFGLSTDFRERIACSHGGRLIEIELARPSRARLWPRTVAVRRFWLAVREHEAFIAALREAAPETNSHTLAA